MPSSTPVLRAYQSPMVDRVRAEFRAGRRRVLMVLPTGGGKCLGAGTPVLMFNGTTKPVEKVVTGDWLMGPDSRPRVVRSVCVGHGELYRVTPTKGEAYVVNADHILSLRMTGSDAISNVTVRDYLRSSKTYRHCAKGWRTGVNFTPPAEAPEIPPYVLGAWLGDGHRNLATITTADDEVAEEWRRYAHSLGLTIRAETMPGNAARNLHAVSRNGFGAATVGGNALMKKLRHLRVLGNKHVPHRYLVGSREERLELLAGLIDTDGSLARTGYDFINKNKGLSEAVAFLARSLGFAAYMKPCVKTCGNNGASGNYWRVSVSGDTHLIPVRVGRKKAPKRRQKKNVLRHGITVEHIGAGAYYGFEIDGDRLFMLGDFTVTHNTICFCYIAANAAARGNRVWILAHRVELVDQISESLRMFNVTHGFIAADYPPRRTSAVHIASVQTLIRRIDRESAPDLIIVDEAHHATADNTIGRILAARPRARVLGVTATPWRLSGEGLGEVFESMVVGPTVSELVDAGALAPAEVYAPPTVDTSSLHTRAGDFVAAEVSGLMDSPKITGDAVDHYVRLAKGLPFIAFTASVEHARHVGDDFTKAGFPCLHVDGGMDRMQRKRIVNDYKEGRLLGLASCELVSEGFDVPGIHCGISLRPTQSLTLWLQQVGRCLRTAPGKDRAIILDHAGNTLRHGLPTELREWTLEGREQAAGKRAASDSISVRVCPSCFAAGKAGRPTCPSCGAPYPVAARKVEEVDGTLEKVEATHVRKPASPLMREQGRTRDLQSLTELGRMRGYKDPAAWAAHIINAREKKRRVGA